MTCHAQHIDTIPALLSCPVLSTEFQQSPDGYSLTINPVAYEDIFSSDITKQKAVTVTYMHLLEIRDRLLA